MTYNSFVRHLGYAFALTVVSSISGCKDSNEEPSSEFNIAVAPPSGSPEIDTVSHHIKVDRPTPFRGMFRMEAKKCTRVNLHFVDLSWAGGRNCTDPPAPTHRRRLLKVKGKKDEVKLLQACCPHNQPCYQGGDDTTGADFLVGVRSDGSLATTVEEFGELCPYEPLQGAVNLPDSLFRRDHYPDLSAFRLNQAPAERTPTTSP